MAAQEASRRGYHAPRRAAGALQTRARIRRAAADLFVAQGYAATSIRAIAESAGVAEKTVYLQFSTKSVLLKEVVDTAITGDDTDPRLYHDWFQSILSTADPDRKLELFADGTAALHDRSGELFAMARGAAAVDAEAADLWAGGKRGHRSEMTRLAENFERSGMLPPGRDLAWAVDTLYVLAGPESWHLVRHELARDRAGYRDWLHETLVRQFLTPDSASEA